MKFNKPKINLVKTRELFSGFGSKIKNLKIKPDQQNAIVKAIKSKYVRVFLLVFLIILAITEFVFAVMIYGFKMDNQAIKMASSVIPYPVAVVNQDFVTYRDFIKEKEYIHHFYESTQQSNMDYNSIDKEILNQLIENKIIAFQAMKNGIKLSQSDVDTAINQIVTQNGGKEKVDKALDELYGLNLDEFESLVKTQLLREKVSDELIMKVTASHILIKVEEGAATEKVDAGKVKIDTVKKEIDEGLDFGEAAKKYSEDVGSAEQGGKLDPFTTGEMVQQFSDTAFKTAVGKISDPVRTEYGWHIIKIENKTGKIERSFNDWLTGIKEKSLILRLV